MIIRNAKVEKAWEITLFLFFYLIFSNIQKKNKVRRSSRDPQDEHPVFARELSDQIFELQHDLVASSEL